MGGAMEWSLCHRDSGEPPAGGPPALLLELPVLVIPVLSGILRPWAQRCLFLISSRRLSKAQWCLRDTDMEKLIQSSELQIKTARHLNLSRRESERKTTPWSSDSQTNVLLVCFVVLFLNNIMFLLASWVLKHGLHKLYIGVCLSKVKVWLR